jgi:hypothetical protein
MEKNFTKNLIVGVLIILVGIVLLLHSLDIIDVYVSGSWVASFIFALGFAIFMGTYIFLGRREFWPLIPAFILLGLSILVSSDDLGLNGQSGSAIFMLFIGLGFLMVFFLHNQHWWAIIPGGVVSSVGLVIFWDSIFGVGLMFLGMGATFLILYPVLILKKELNPWWTLIPGSILAFMGIMFVVSYIHLSRYVLPIILIVIGIILVLRTSKKSNPSTMN